jgi:hypothetical protein
MHGLVTFGNFSVDGSDEEEEVISRIESVPEGRDSVGGNGVGHRGSRAWGSKTHIDVWVRKRQRFRVRDAQ